MIVAASGAVRRLLGTDRFRRGRCRRVNAVESCEVEKWGKIRERLDFRIFLDRIIGGILEDHYYLDY